MVSTAFSFTFNVLRVALAIIGLVALGLTALLAVPLGHLPWLESISRTVRAVDRSDMPDVSRFQARDGSTLALRHYPAQVPGVARIAVVVHGSSGSSASVHALSRALAAAGVETFAPDIRGHGASGTRGDIGYIGQLEDDMADLVGEIRKSRPDAPLTLIGHSSGGAFVLRVAGSPIQTLFERMVMLSPYLGYDAPSSRADSGGWARADVPRFLALALLNRIGIDWANALPSLAFAVAPESKLRQTDSYSYRLMRNFATAGYREDLAAATRPLALFAGAADELMISDQYQGMFGDRVSVKLLDGVNHMGIVCDAAAVATIADDVAKAPAR
jgi:alpha-beta hydrolase superfamily lysophospholipase